MASIVLVSLNEARKKARDAKRITDLTQVAKMLELFYDKIGRYPAPPGGATWADHWQQLNDCLASGVTCGFTLTNYQPVTQKIPQDPTAGKTYVPPYGNCPQGYVLRATLENNNPILQSAADSDGDLCGAGGSCTNGCADSSYYFCIKQNWCC